VGCDRIQGYYFSKPLPLDEFEAKGYGALSGEELRKPSDSDIVLHPIDFDEIFSGNAATNRLLNSLAGGLGLYEFMGSSLELIKTNSTYYDILGFDTDSVDSYSSNVHKLVFEDDVEKSINACRAVIATGKSQRITVRHYHHNGNLVYLDCVYNYLGGTDECPLICISFNDITERFLLKSKEDDYRAYLESIMSAVPGGIVLYEISPDKVRAIYFNDTAAEIAGCTREEYAELYSN
jgi:PAS domain-containing protein